MFVSGVISMGDRCLVVASIVIRGSLGINVELMEIAARKWLNGEVWYIYWIVLN